MSAAIPDGLADQPPESMVGADWSSLPSELSTALQEALQPWDAANRELLQQVHPPDWPNPTPASRYNLVVLGAGTAGLVAAAGAAGLGAKVALVERGLMGGDCLNRGCVPSKALLAAARAVATARHLETFGGHVPELFVDFPTIMQRLRQLRAKLSPHDSAARFRDLGVDVFLGTGQFTAPDTLTVNGQSLRFARAVLATGSRPRIPEIPGLMTAGYLTNETIFSLPALPKRLAILGAGPIGCELAQAFARLGSAVTLIYQTDLPLPREISAAGQRLVHALQRDGVQLRPNCTISEVVATAAGRQLMLAPANSPKPTAYDGVPANETIMVDELLIAVGRQPNVDHLGLETAGVAFDSERGVHVDARLRSSNRNIFAAGDVIGAYQFTHAADAQARLALRNALFWGRGQWTDLIIPWCTYTDPEVARIGPDEAELQQRQLDYTVFEQPLAKVDRAVLEAADDGFVRLLVKRGTDRILGGTIVAAHAGEMICTLSLAMTTGIGLKRWASAIHPYPTQAEALKKIADAYNRTRLTPWLKKLFHLILAWRRQ